VEVYEARARGRQARRMPVHTRNSVRLEIQQKRHPDAVVLDGRGHDRRHAAGHGARAGGGRPADARTDLRALRAILCEMLTGKRAFEGTSAASLIGAIPEREPAPLSTLQPVTPPGVDRLVRRCLAKDPDARWDTAHDVAALSDSRIGYRAALTSRTSVNDHEPSLEATRLRIGLGAALMGCPILIEEGPTRHPVVAHVW
jgi:serine/threonine protein kinase